ncbi:MAG: hypothetical protein JWM95_3271 [Gemmatimonadetes bacterium]|nr:hypothetical protein [Gemmatimonadota bacterium]
MKPARVSDVVLAAGALALSAAGVGSVYGTIVSLVADHLAGRRVAQLEDRVAAVNRRIDRLQSAGGVALRGTSLRLMALVLETELETLWAMLDADDAIARLGIDAAQYGDAARELEHLGLVDAHVDANDETGIARTTLTPTALLRVGPTMFAQLDWADYVARILASLERDTVPDRIFLTERLAETTSVPLPRLELLLRALDALGVVEDHGPGGAHGSFLSVILTTKGLRVSRGDEGLFD